MAGFSQPCDDGLVAGAVAGKLDGVGADCDSRGRRVFGEASSRASAAMAYDRDQGEKTEVGARDGIGSSRG